MVLSTITMFDTDVSYQNSIIHIGDDDIVITWRDVDKSGVLRLDPNTCELFDGVGSNIGQIASISFDETCYCKILMSKPANKKYHDIFTAGLSCVVYSPELTDISDLTKNNSNVSMGIVGMRAIDNEWLCDTEIEIDLTNNDVIIDDVEVGKYKTVLAI